jgi:hypothetical protein
MKNYISLLFVALFISMSSEQEEVLHSTATIVFFEHWKCYVIKIIILNCELKITVFWLKKLKKLVLDFVWDLLLVT